MLPESSIISKGVKSTIFFVYKIFEISRDTVNNVTCLKQVLIHFIVFCVELKSMI